MFGGISVKYFDVQKGCCEDATFMANKMGFTASL